LSGGAWPTDILVWLVRESKLMTLEQMHYKLSYHPARVIGLKDRGAILEGMAADLVVYELDKLYVDRSFYQVVRDMPNEDWRRRINAGGYEYIIVNGQPTFHRDQRTGAHSGQVLSAN
jgi:N-acyl-D-amino-acid deacylase